MGKRVTDQSKKIMMAEFIWKLIYLLDDTFHCVAMKQDCEVYLFLPQQSQ
jgi:hypothetical protein